MENELKGGRMVTLGIQTGPRIVHIDKGVVISVGGAMISDFRYRYAFTIFH